MRGPHDGRVVGSSFVEIAAPNIGATGQVGDRPGDPEDALRTATTQPASSDTISTRCAATDAGEATGGPQRRPRAVAR